MTRAGHPKLVLLAALTLAMAGCFFHEEDETDAPLECVTTFDCPGFIYDGGAPTPCLMTACVAGRCERVPVAEGTFVSEGLPGDCHRDVCNAEGAVVSVWYDLDLPNDWNVCTHDRCSYGFPSHPPVDAGITCAQDGGTRCDGSGACVQCLAPADCGNDTECQARTCTSGICGVAFVPFGTPLAEQTAGACRKDVCDGTGHETTVADDAKLPVDGNACTADRCTAGVPSNPPVSAGATCSGPNGAVLCNGAGACVQCLSAASCPGTDGDCQHRTCAGGSCGVAYASAGTPLPSQTSGDCLEVVCDGAGGAGPVACPSDVPVDGDECTAGSCAEGGPSQVPAAPGTACSRDGGAVCDGAGACVACNVGEDCASRVCAEHVCQAPTCSDEVRNGAETDVDCGGATCDDCVPGDACLVGADCASGVCTAGTCRAPTCGDGVKNGSETATDCGGSCAACAFGQACLVDADCRSANCCEGTCGAARVTATVPADGAMDVAPGAAVTVTFSATFTTSTVTVQASSGPCSGSVQLSGDGFATCLGLTKAFSADSRSVAVQPVEPLARSTTYRVRTTSGVANTAIGGFEPFESAAGFTTVGGGACGGALVISQVYPGGGLPNAAYRHDFVELHNNGPVPVRLDGLSVQYALPPYGAWAVTPLSGILPPGAYLLVRYGGSAGGAGIPLPAADAIGTSDLSPVGGKIALASSTIPFSANCPSAGRLDVVGYGTGTSGSVTSPTNCYEGTAPAPAPADHGAALVRAGGGCGDGNGSDRDFASQLPVPRTSASAPAVCGCSGTAVNGTGMTAELDWCDVHFPLAMTAGAGEIAAPVYGQVFEAGVTEPAGPPPLLAELGLGPVATDPRWSAGWTFAAATWHAQTGGAGNANDEFRASFTAPSAPGSYAYVYRFSPDGQRWTYCDPNGAGSAPGSPFEPNTLPVVTVTAP